MKCYLQVLGYDKALSFQKYLGYTAVFMLRLTNNVALLYFLSNLISKSASNSRNHSSFLKAIFSVLYCIIVGSKVV